MKVKVIVLGILVSCIVLFGRNYYIQCYRNIMEYDELRTEVVQEQNKVNALSEKTKELLQKSDVPALSKFENIQELTDCINSIRCAELVEISALEVCSDRTALYIATIENTCDVSAFTNRLNGLEFVLETNNSGECLKELSKVECLFHRISIDEVNNRVHVQILIV